MSTVSRSSHSSRTLVRAAAVAACAGALLAFPAAAALAGGVPAASSAHAAGSAAPQRTLVKTASLADGSSTAHVYRVAKDAYRAEVLSADGSKAATVTSRDGVTGFGGSGKLHLALRADGRLSSWVGGDSPVAKHGAVGSGHKTASRDGVVVAASAPLGEAASGPTAALRLHTVADGPGDGVLLLAAGGGIAAMGAAGLGFAMLRRGRTDS
ncbi:hypothetical protein J7E97_18120 [Streptomyces sp. ISL-66]|uniref:hypothetical protein n=1 Tax=Streptomyces sp. ISL-66 TaxID=2819186 RepID=UPI001BE85B84|nr:hypothetical protein [Streptomyces sp. ISL-66]MBT2469739.1 hypothetical protein [Streptomyces sp. ISL-66]